jgi:phage gp29-like protein
MSTGLYLGTDEYVTFAEALRRLGRSDPRRLAVHVATRERGPEFMGLGMWLPNPDPVLKKMGKDLAVYRGLRADAHTGGCIRRRKAAVKALEWRVERGRASERMTAIAQAVFDGLDMDTLLDQMLDATLYGYQPHEILWQPQPGAAPLPGEIIGKPPEWFLFDGEARLRFRSRESLSQGELLEPRKFMLTRQEASYDNPYGFADLSMCFWPVTFKHGGLRYWVKFAEKYGMPWAVGKQPRNAPKPEADRLLDQLEAMIEDAVAVIPDDASVEMLQAAGASGNADAYRELLLFCRGEVAIALLGQNQSTEQDSTNASATAGLGVATDLRDGHKRMVEGVLNTQLIRWIVDFHEGEDAPTPSFVMWEHGEVSKAQAERDEILTRAGLRFSPRYFTRVYELQEGDIDAAPAAAGAALFAEGQPVVDPAARIADDLAPAGQAIVADWMRRIETLLAQATSIDDLQQRLAAAFDELPEDDLVTVMRLALTAARLSGMDAVRQEAA